MNKLSVYKKTLANEHFFKTLLVISFPMMLQNLLISSLSFVDTLMIGQLGEIEIAAVGLANQMFFLVILFFFGIGSGSSIFIAQFWGAGDIPSIHKTMGIALATSLFGAFTISILSISIPEQIMRIFSPDQAVIETGAVYLKIVGISYVFSGISFIFSSALRSTEDAKTPLFVTAISLTLNAILNYLLIFGSFGFPEMGVSGAALATTISRGVEMAVLLIVVYWKKKVPAGSLSVMFSINKVFIRNFFKTALPVILNEFFWSTGMVVYKMVYARMGTQVIAAANVSESIQSLFFVVLMGTGNTAAVMIGKKIGAKEKETAAIYSHVFLFLAVVLGICLGLIMVVTAPYIPRAFRLSPEIIRTTTRALMMMAIVIPFKSFNMHGIVGILRSGGDTRFSLLLELTSVWCIGVPCALFGGFVLKLPIYYLLLFVGLEELYKMILCGIRIRSGKWMNDLTASTTVPVIEPQILGTSNPETF